MYLQRALRTGFVDIVKFAVRGLRARAIGLIRSLTRAVQQSKDASMRHMITHSRGFIGFVSALVGLTASMTVWAVVSGHPLLNTEAPDFALKAFSGDNVRLSEHRGDVIVLTFWSGGCAPCALQLAMLDRSYKTYQSAGLQMYGISVDDNATREKRFAAAHDVGFTLLADPKKNVSRRYEVDQLPLAVLIDRNGIVRSVHREFSPQGEELYLQQLRTLLNE
jgi:peroxiredoxin